MPDKTQIHFTKTYIEKITHCELNTGAEITLRVRVKCTDFCDLRGHIVRITDKDDEVQEFEIIEYNGAENAIAAFVVNIPGIPGIYTWRAEFIAQERDGKLHQGSLDEYAFTFKPHTISIAVWDVNSPIVVNKTFSAKIGVKCSANCSLLGNELEIYNHKGIKVGSGTLGDKQQSSANTTLFSTEIGLQAPGVEGKFTWQIKVQVSDLMLSHDEARQKFSFQVVKAPDHTVKITVVEKDTHSPIKNSQVFLHPYKATTNNDGVVFIEVPKGNYKLYVSKKDFETFRTTVIVASDIDIKADLIAEQYLLEDS